MFTEEERRQRAYAATKKWAHANRSKVNGYVRRWAQLNPTRKHASERNARLKRKYGIRQRHWDELFDAQGRKCAICETKNPGNRYGWNTDHDHETGVIRGILCHCCNLMVHRFASPTVLRSAADYIEKAQRKPWPKFWPEHIYF